MQETILSGIRASGKLHLGNYLGALKQFVELQNGNSSAEASAKADCYFFIADLHALTTPFEPKELSQNTLEVAAEYLAAGIDPDKSVFFLQSQVLEHAQLAWIFNCLTSIGELERMTQFKEKTEFNVTARGRTLTMGHPNKFIGAGLLTYPTLMAADILLYKPTAVPVGDDQTQHVELTRDIAKKFNNRFGETFPIPKTFEPARRSLGEGGKKPLRIMSLTDPTKKMSKTGDEALMLADSPDEILRKLKKAVTATDTNQGSPGVDNLKFLLDQFGGTDQVQDFTKYNDVKETLAKVITNYFADFREKKAKLLQNPKQVTDILNAGAAKAQKIASRTLNEVKAKIGLI
ncbi:MAG: tryptophan--tRNA ligase [Candidatus Doudnabacteria bacterium RIFCSPHIGHO2_01_FULL_45_18]|uniref:Tryptophan--tRNA ligase n=1 Tax=Candidatus Doudnabacteria bacterium RIFCSPHIGHO2_01_FULL_45_18 TaxID=1817823 RepID=A0A1F5NR18_9BACT|nr:MAG: tryptophan--tRNA ligase [Candidatus Doudnabacteria bacterium RIFCSPHIGHO2_01_FULL_45_18]